MSSFISFSSGFHLFAAPSQKCVYGLHTRDVVGGGALGLFPPAGRHPCEAVDEPCYPPCSSRSLPQIHLIPKTQPP